MAARGTDETIGLEGLHFYILAGPEPKVFYKNEIFSYGKAAFVFISLLERPHTTKALQAQTGMSYWSIATTINRMARKLKAHKTPFAIGRIKLYGTQVQHVLLHKDEVPQLKGLFT